MLPLCGRFNKYRADFIFDNLTIQTNIIHTSFVNKINNLIFSDRCVYPKDSKQPIKENMLTGELEKANEPYARKNCRNKNV